MKHPEFASVNFHMCISFNSADIDTISVSAENLSFPKLQ
jgi:hypothetical protein